MYPGRSPRCVADPIPQFRFGVRALLPTEDIPWKIDRFGQ